MVQYAGATRLSLRAVPGVSLYGPYLASFPRKRESIFSACRAQWIPDFAGVTPDGMRERPPHWRHPGESRDPVRHLLDPGSTHIHVLAGVSGAGRKLDPGSTHIHVLAGVTGLAENWTPARRTSMCWPG